MLVWSGPSQLDGETPLVVLATYDSNPLKKSSDNVKTGDMVQTYIMRADMHPYEAIKAGADTAICGKCPHNSVAAGGSGACYVEVWKAPSGIWAAYDRNRNGDHGKHNQSWTIPLDLEAFRDRKVRFGAYGDPASVPFEVWESIAGVAEDVTGYTHQWRTADPRFARYCMASADSTEEGEQAFALGYRSFIVREPGTPKPKGAVQCPASKEAGKRTVCADCLQCGGTSNGRRSDITIMAHGGRKSKFRPLALSVVAPKVDYNLELAVV